MRSILLEFVPHRDCASAPTATLVLCCAIAVLAWPPSGFGDGSEGIRIPAYKATVDRLIADLEALHDEATGLYLIRPGLNPAEHGVLQAPGWPELACLTGLDLKQSPHLLATRDQLTDSAAVVSFATAGWRPPGDFRTWELVVAQAMQITAVPAQALITAAESQRNFPEAQDNLLLSHPIGHAPDTVGWHSPQMVYALAVVHRHHADLHADTHLREILDFWIEQMPQNPHPVQHSVNGTTVIDASPYAHLPAIAALHLGSQIFGDARYARGRDAQHEWLRQLMERNTLAEPADKAADSLAETMVAYGQACMLMEDAAGVRSVRKWIIGIVEAGEASEHYQRATFRDRCGMIAVLQGEPGMLTPPRTLVLER